jgi:hypothetical protein
MSSDDPPSFDELITDVNGQRGPYSCPICGEFDGETVRSVQGHISGSKDDVHADLGWNYETEIEATKDDR